MVQTQIYTWLLEKSYLWLYGSLLVKLCLCFLICCLGSSETLDEEQDTSKEQVSFDFMVAVTICSDFEAQENSLSLFPLFPHLYAMKWWDWMPCSSIFECWVLSQLFHSSLSPSSRDFSSSFLSAIRMVSPAYMRSLVFLWAILIPDCASSNLTFLMMYSSYRLNKQGENI